MKRSDVWSSTRRFGPWIIDLYGALIDGRPECVGVTLRVFLNDAEASSYPDMASARPVTTAALRKLPLGSLIAESREGWASMMVAFTDRAREAAAEGRDTAAWLAAVQPYEAAARSGLQQSGKGRPPLYGLEHFAEVAQLYRRAWLTGDPAPTKRVAERWSVSRSAAAKWVARAREFGYLGKTAKRRAGGAHEAGGYPDGEAR